MREILFRGKTKDRWVYGSLVTGIHGSVPVIFTEPSVLEFEFDHVYPETVGQYTGLTDKNGKKIFEGDIINHALSDAHVYIRYCVNWSEWDGCFRAFEHGLSGYSYNLTLSHGHLPRKRVEVIGNIYDNPELLGGADNAAD